MLIQILKDWQILGFSGLYPFSMPIRENIDLYQWRVAGAAMD